MLEVFQGNRYFISHMVVMPPNPTILDTNPRTNNANPHICFRTYPTIVPHLPLRLTYTPTLMPPLINAVKMWIPLHWGSTQVSTIPEWLKRVEKIAKMEELISIAKDCPAKFSHTWACWSHFCTTDRYKSLIGQTLPDLIPQDNWDS